MPPSKHAILSASSSHRWLNCPPSARLELEFEDRETEAAAEGTAAHALCEHKLRRALKRQSRKPISKYDCDEMDTHTDNYVQFVLETISEASQHCADPIINIEQRLDFSCYVPDGFGTGDCIIIADRTLHVIDFKYGQGVLVEAEHNPQMMSSLAQEESRSISENCTWGQRKRFADGKVSVPYARFLGYDKGEDGKMVINQEEAKVVRRIFSLFLQGMTAHGIAKLLTDDGIPTPGHKTKWSARTVSSILSNEKYKGDALLQKSYTVDFLTKKQRRNNGEIQQYYVEGNHEAIIAPEIFDMVQRELALRKPGANRHSGVRVFSGTVYCAECGGLYGSKLWHSNDQYRRVMWRCNHKYDNDQHCHTPSLTEEELQAAFLSSFNKLLTERDEIQANYELIKEQLYGLKDLESELASISAEEEVAAELINQCIRENARVALNQDDYNTRYQALCDRHDAIQARLDSVEAEIKRRKLRRSDIDRFIGDLMRQPAIITTFDPILWSTMVERVTVHGKNDIRFTFRNGTEITA